MEPTTSQAKSRKTGERLFKTIKVSAIPLLTDLRKQLGYGNAGQEQDIAFKKAVREQVEEFVSSDHIEAYRFTQWRNTSHQKGLVEITKEFLDTKGKGSEFWPDTDSSANKKSLQYSKDSVKIRNLMIKVFWRSARECKRSTPRNPTNPSLPSPCNDTSDERVKSEKGPSDTNGAFLYCIPDPKRGSAQDPICLDEMQSNSRDPGAPTNNFDPFASYTMFAPRDDAPDDRPISPNPLFSPVVSDIVGVGSRDRASHNTNKSRTVRREGTHRPDPYDVPNSPPRVTFHAQDKGKRPAEPDFNDNSDRSKAPRHGQSNAEQPTGQASRRSAGEKTKSYPTATRTPLPTRPTTIIGRGTQEQMGPIDEEVADEEAADEAYGYSFEDESESSYSPSPLPLAKYGSYANQGQQEKGNANGSSSSTSASRAGNFNGSGTEKQGQPSTGSAAVATRMAEQETAEAATALDNQAGASTGLGAAQGNIPTTSTNQAPISQNRNFEAGKLSHQSIVSQEKDSSSSQVLYHNGESREGRFYVTNEEQRAWDNADITLRSNIANGIDHVIWEPSSDFLQMSLKSVTDELGLKNYGTLHISFRSREERLPRQIIQGDEDGFRSFKEECLAEMSYEYKIAALASVSAQCKFRYVIRFSILG